MNARDGFRSGIELMQQSARLMGVMPASGLFCDWKELDAKFEAFRLFQYADRELKAPIDRMPLDEAVERALALEPFRAIWVLEGIGHIKGGVASAGVEGLLTDGPGARVPDRVLIPLHAGMGTAFAEKLLEELGRNASTDEITVAVERFTELCRANCRPGWEHACMESLGLVVRCLYPHLLAPVSSAMEALDPALRSLFWHGVGRSLYFVPTNFLPIPGAHERMVKGAASEGSRIEDRSQALAGLIWAVTLVNLPRPAGIRKLLPVCSELRIRSEFSNGLVSALLAWRNMAPGDLRYSTKYTRPLPAGDRESILWRSWVETPAREALEDLLPGLERSNRIPALYTYRTLEELRELSGAVREERTGSRT